MFLDTGLRRYDGLKRNFINSAYPGKAGKKLRIPRKYSGFRSPPSKSAETFTEALEVNVMDRKNIVH
jgi:hypothetical protein